MAQTGYTPIKLYHSTTSSAVPLAADLSNGELAINIVDGLLYYKDGSGAVKVLANATINQLTFPLSAANGGTGQSSYTTGDLLYASGSTTLSKLNLGTAGYILTAGASAPQWTSPGSAFVGTATNLAGGTAGAIAYQSAANTTTFLTLGTTNYVLTAGATEPQYVAQSTLSVGSAATATSATTATNLAGGANGSLPYQTGSGATTFLSPGTNGQVLTLAGGVPTWAASTGGVTSFSAGTTGLTPSSATTGAIVLGGTLGVANGGTGLTSLTAGRIPYGNGTSAFSNSANLAFDGTTLVVGPTVLAGTVNPIVAATGSLNNYIQSYIYNSNTGVSASADLVAYADNSSDLHGWADLGFTSSNYADTTYTITGPNEAYLFGSALNNTYTGNLVYATDSTGSANSHQWYVGGFTQAKSAWKMQLTTAGLQLANALSIANGGTGQTTATAAFNALSPIATTGDLIVGNGTNSATRLPIGANTYILTSNGTTATWSSPPTSGASLSNDITTASNLYPLFAAATSGTPTTIYTSDAKYLYKPSTGELQASEILASNGVILNNQVMNASYSMPAGYSSMSVGPFSVASGVTFTIPSGSRHVVL
jgi:hypothetical protein